LFYTSIAIIALDSWNLLELDGALVEWLAMLQTGQLPFAYQFVVGPPLSVMFGVADGLE
jgi:hypothetical protein